MTNPAPSTRLVILEDRRGGGDAQVRPPMRRYRIARLRLEGPPAAPDCRFEYLKHAHD